MELLGGNRQRLRMRKKYKKKRGRNNRALFIIKRHRFEMNFF
jgi:hypothetical protein